MGPWDIHGRLGCEETRPTGFGPRWRSVEKGWVGEYISVVRDLQDWVRPWVPTDTGGGYKRTKGATTEIYRRWVLLHKCGLLGCHLGLVSSHVPSGRSETRDGRGNENDG